MQFQQNHMSKPSAPLTKRKLLAVIPSQEMPGPKLDAPDTVCSPKATALVLVAYSTIVTRRHIPEGGILNMQQVPIYVQSSAAIHLPFTGLPTSEKRSFP